MFSLMLIAAAAAAWWLDGAIVPQQRAGAVMAGGGGGQAGGNPFSARHPARGAGRRGDSMLLNLGFPGPDGRGQWVLPDRVHLTALAGAVGLLAMIIFVGGTLGGGGNAAPAALTSEQTAPAIDFAATGQASTEGTVAPAGDGTTVPETQNSADAVTVTPPATGAGATGAENAVEVGTAPIVLPTPTAPLPAPARPLDAPASLPTADESIVHEVVSGDTIYDLAITYGSSIEAILDANGLGGNATINIGDRLLVPAVESSSAVE
ncbi:MAG: LysM repeat-containing protein [Chloroflexi bacterium]|nr:MAG: LysM repeat-containing protein [Chloroflexota bacterium]